MNRWIRRYATIFSICLSERLTYRTDFFFGTLMRFMPIVTTIFLWSAIFEGTGSPDARIAGLTSQQMVSYYLMVMISRAFSSMPGLSSGIATDVRDGHIKKYLTQPISMMGFLVTMRVAHKLIYYGIAVGPFVIVFLLCRSYLPEYPGHGVLAAYIVSLIIAFLVGFLLEAWIGLLAFWFLEIGSFSFIVMALNYLLSGHMFPLDLFPGWIGTIVQMLPFQYLAYFPAKLWLQGATWTAGQFAAAFAQQLVTLAVLLALVRFTYARGLKRYSAFGG